MGHLVDQPSPVSKQGVFAWLDLKGMACQQNGTGENFVRTKPQMFGYAWREPCCFSGQLLTG